MAISTRLGRCYRCSCRCAAHRVREQGAQGHQRGQGRNRLRRRARGAGYDGVDLAAGLSRSWTTYYWLLQRGRWTWLAVWQALLRVLKMLFDPPVWHVVLDDTLVERISARAPGSLIHHNHTAKPNRPRFL